VIPSGRLVALLVLPLLLGAFALVFPGAIFPMVALDACILVVAILDACTRRRGPTVTRSVPAVQAVGRPFSVALTIANQSSGFLHLQITDDHPGKSTGLPLSADLESGTHVELDYQLTIGVRGRHLFGPVTVRWRSGLGLWRRQRRFAVEGVLRVYPSFEQLRSWGLKARQDEQRLPVRVRRRPGGENEFQRLRPYVFGDNYRHIDWKATARKREFVTREFGQESNQNLIFLLDAGRTMSGQNGGMTSFDHALNSALMMGQVALRHGDRVGLLAFDSEIRVWHPPKGGTRSGGRLIRATYDLFPSLKEPNYQNALQYLSTHVRRRSLVVLLTAVSDEMSADTVTAMVRAMSTRHLPLCVWLRDSSIESLVYGQRETRQDHYVGGAAAELLTSRERSLNSIRGRGALVVDCSPDRLTAGLLSRYLEVKARRLL
jgi:uncharacterized protein (DUF58 family)